MVRRKPDSFITTVAMESRKPSSFYKLAVLGVEEVDYRAQRNLAQQNPHEGDVTHLKANP
jgi:hypothetical protein